VKTVGQDVRGHLSRSGAAVVLAAVLLVAAPAGVPVAAGVAGAATSSTSTTSTSTSTTAPTTPTTLGPPAKIAVDPNNLAQQASEVPAAEAQLVGLLGTVQSRIANLDLQLQSLDKNLADNQQALIAADRELAARQEAAVVANERLSALGDDIATARNQLRARAVDAYVRDPTGELFNLILHLKDAAELSDVRTFYRTVIDVQAKAVQRYAKLRAEADKASKSAAAARDRARFQQQTVAAQKTLLTSLRTTFSEIQQESQAQQAQQTTLLGQAQALKDAFVAAVNQQQQLSDEIGNLLRQLESASSSGGPPIAPTVGYFTLPIPSAVITSPFGPRLDPLTGLMGFHPGVDFGANLGTPIQAAGDGTVVWAGPNGGYGNCTIIDHGHGLATLYAHQSNILVHVGDQVTHGQVIGQVGSTGYSTGPHLHFEVRVNGTPVDPVPYL
jgi:murein DD-endopeptidase MepM/ murein hydrolase activator NlpD